MKITKDNLLIVDNIDYNINQGKFSKLEYYGKYVADQFSLIYVDKSGIAYSWICGAIKSPDFNISMEFFLDKLVEKEKIGTPMSKIANIPNTLAPISSSDKTIESIRIDGICQLKAVGYSVDEIVKLKNEGLI